MVRRTVGGAGGFEERRKGERYKLSLPVQLNDGIGITCDISTSGIFFETGARYSIGDTIRLSLISNTRPFSARRAWCGWSRTMVNSASPWS